MSRLGLTPLSSLYVAAGMMLTIGLIAADINRSDDSVVLLYGLFVGQLWLIGGWAATGRATRLVRGFGALGAMLVMTTVISLTDGGYLDIDRWGRAIAPTCVVAAPAFVSALVMKVILGRRERFQFPIMEVLCWMIVVAIVATLLGLADFRHIVSESGLLLRVAGAGGAAGLVIAVHRFRQTVAWRWRVLSWLGLSAMVLASVASGGQAADRELSVPFVFAGIYLFGALTARAADRKLADALNAELQGMVRFGSTIQQE